MLISILIVAAVFGYATYTLRKFFQKSKQGKCAGCEIKNTCQSNLCGIDEKDK